MGPWLWVLLGSLLCFSALFSASETAFFSLSVSERDRSSATVRALLQKPRDLLATVLFGNLVINVLFFAFAARLKPGDEGWGDGLATIGALLAVLIGGEIVPKSLAIRGRESLARVTAPPLLILFGLLAPLRRVLVFLLDACARLLGSWARERPGLTPETLALVLEESTSPELLEESEADLLAEIVELEGIRVREIMTPRVDVIFLDQDGGNREEATRAALEQRLSWLPVADGDADHIVGRVRVRDLLLHPERRVPQMVMPVKFVPEVGSSLTLLRDLSVDRTAEAVVVDEWGGTAGIITLEDIFEELVGELRAEDEAVVREVVPLGEGRYRVSGGLSIRDWNERFGSQVVPMPFETLGGFVAALLGRIPRAGDEVHHGSLVMEVHEVRGRRVLAVDIGVEGSEEVAAAS